MERRRRRRPQGLAGLLAWGVLCICLASSEEPTTEGLTSTSLVEFTVISHLEPVDSSEQSNLEATEPDLFPSALQASEGSGFASEENEESKILQPPQYFWDDGGDLNDSSLDMGPATDYSFPLASQKAPPKENRTQAKDSWDAPSFQQSSEPDPRTPFSDALEEDEGLLPINQSQEGQQSSQAYWPKEVSSEPAGQEESSLSLLFSTVASGLVVTKAAGESQEEDSVPEHTSLGFDLGSSMGPALLPGSSILSVSTAGSKGVSEHATEVTSGNVGGRVGAGVELARTVTTAESTQTVVGAGVEPTELPGRGELTEPMLRMGGEQVEATVLTGMESTVEALEVTSVRSSHPQDPRIFSGSAGGSPSASSWADPLDRADEPAPTPAPNDTNLTTETMAAEWSFVPRTGDAQLAVLSTGMPWNSAQVICKDWSNLAGKNYIILNMSDNIDCEEFRLEKGPQLLALVEDAFSRQTDGVQVQWLISLSKPNENDKHLLMTLAGTEGVVPTKDVLMALGYVKRSLAEIGIQNYSTTTSCQSRPSQTRSDYGKLFVVLVIIGSTCAIIIILGLIYNCWQRRLPKMKNMSHGEELRFVENGCHDNPTLDVASDSQPEMQEKKPSVNGGDAINGPDGWDVLLNKRASEDTDVFEEDTHL